MTELFYPAQVVAIHVVKRSRHLIYQGKKQMKNLPR